MLDKPRINKMINRLPQTSSAQSGPPLASTGEEGFCVNSITVEKVHVVTKKIVAFFISNGKALKNVELK